MLLSSNPSAAAAAAVLPTSSPTPAPAPALHRPTTPIQNRLPLKPLLLSSNHQPQAHLSSNNATTGGGGGGGAVSGHLTTNKFVSINKPISISQPPTKPLVTIAASLHSLQQSQQQQQQQPAHSHTPISISSIQSQQPQHQSTSPPQLPTPQSTNTIPTTATTATVTPPTAGERLPIIQSTVTVRQPDNSRFLLNGSTYTKLATIGRGGSSLVYKVISSKGSIYALKEINLSTHGSGGDENANKNNHIPDYLTEVQTLHEMHGDPYVIQMHLAQEDKTNKFFYMLMECGSCDLDKHLNTIRINLSMTQDSPLLPILTVKYFWQSMLQCVASIHSRGIIHTDLKPVNFIFNEFGILKLIDFGIAKSVAEEATSAVFQKPVGTLNYMSPESLPEDGGKLRASSDIWSLGCILYSWIYGEPPFGRITNHVKKWLAIQNEQERIFFHQQITIIEQVTDPAAQQSGTKTLKGNGVHVNLNEKGCTITRTYPTLPAHLHQHTLPRTTIRQVDPRVIDVLEHCLQRKPSSRPTAQQLLQHPYLNESCTPLLPPQPQPTPIEAAPIISPPSPPSPPCPPGGAPMPHPAVVDNSKEIQLQDLQTELERLRSQLQQATINANATKNTNSTTGATVTATTIATTTATTPAPAVATTTTTTTPVPISSPTPAPNPTPTPTPAPTQTLAPPPVPTPIPVPVLAPVSVPSLATPLNRKRPLTSLFSTNTSGGAKKLGLGKAVRVTPGSMEPLEEEDLD